MVRSLRAAVVVALVPLAMGCSPWRRPGFPRQSYDEGQLIRDLEAQLTLPDQIKLYYDRERGPTTPEEKKGLRDEIVTGRLALIDLNYNQFIQAFSFNKQALDTVMDFAELGANLATTMVDAAGSKANLGAISAGLRRVQKRRGRGARGAAMRPRSPRNANHSQEWTRADSHRRSLPPAARRRCRARHVCQGLLPRRAPPQEAAAARR